MAKLIDLLGQRFGTLVVIGRDYNKLGKDAHWIVLCDCGKQKSVHSISLRKNKNNGCKFCSQNGKNNPNYRHGLRHTRIYNILANMKSRCYNSNDYHFEWYGAKGVTICAEWLNAKSGLKNFYDWSIQNGYKNNLTIDRINPFGNYEPSNCRWATTKEQRNNQRKNYTHQPT